MKRTVFLAITIFMFTTLAVNAEPSPTVSALMKEPVTMMDWGLMRLDDHMEKVAKNEAIENLAFSVFYSWDQNKIIILGRVPFSKKLNAMKCKEIWMRVASSAFLSEANENQKQRLWSMATIFSDFFASVASRKHGQPSRLGHELSELTFLNLLIGGVSCGGRVIDEDPSVYRK